MDINIGITHTGKKKYIYTKMSLWHFTLLRCTCLKCLFYSLLVLSSLTLKQTLLLFLSWRSDCLSPQYTNNIFTTPKDTESWIQFDTCWQHPMWYSRNISGPLLKKAHPEMKVQPLSALPHADGKSTEENLTYADLCSRNRVAATEVD